MYIDFRIFLLINLVVCSNDILHFKKSTEDKIKEHEKIYNKCEKEPSFKIKFANFSPEIHKIIQLKSFNNEISALDNFTTGSFTERISENLNDGKKIYLKPKKFYELSPQSKPFNEANTEKKKSDENLEVPALNRTLFKENSDLIEKGHVIENETSSPNNFEKCKIKNKLVNAIAQHPKQIYSEILNKQNTKYNIGSDYCGHDDPCENPSLLKKNRKKQLSLPRIIGATLKSNKVDYNGEGRIPGNLNISKESKSCSNLNIERKKSSDLELTESLYMLRFNKNYDYPKVIKSSE